MADHWKVTAVMASPLAGDPPYLDAILEYEMAQRQGKSMAILRSDPAPPVGEIHLPLLRGDFGGHRGIPRCSAPILAPAKSRHEHFAKRLGVEHSGLLREDQRLVVSTKNNWTKSYRLPLIVRDTPRVSWFVGGSKRRSLRSLLKTVRSIGKKRSQGYGVVVEWIVEPVEHDWSWFAPTERGTLLMRCLPFCDELPSDMIGYKRWFGGYAPPYWHPERFLDLVTPV